MKILVTGATGALGSSIVKHLLSKNHEVFGTSTSENDHMDGVKLYACDLTNQDATKDLFEVLQKEHENIDAVVLTAGGFGMGNVRDSNLTDFMKMFDINFSTAYNTAHFAINSMKETGGKLMFIGAKPALEGGGSEVLPYALSKNAVVELSRLIDADEEIPNIRSYVIAPSVIDTPANRDSMPDEDFSKWVTPDTIAKTVEHILSDTGNIYRDTVLKLYNRS